MKLHKTILILGILACAACRRSPQEKAASALESGKAYLAKSDYAHAMIEFRRAVQFAPNEAEAYFQAGLTYAAMLDIPSAAINFKKAVELNPKHAQAQIHLAELLSASRDKRAVEDASTRAKEALKLAPGDTSALNTLAIAEFRLGDKGAAEAHLQEALKRVTGNARTAINLAIMRLYNKDPQGALAILKTSAERNSQSSELALVLGRLYAAMGDAGAAERELRRAASLDRNNGPAVLSLAGFLTATKRPAEAEATYKQAAQLKDKKYHPLLGLYLWQTGKREGALAEFQRLAQANPGDTESRQRLVTAYRMLGRNAEAGKVLEAAYQRNPKDSAVRLEHARSLIQQGKLGDAESVLRLLISDQRDSADGHYLLSQIFTAKHQPRLRQQELELALQANSAFLTARLEMADSLLEMHRSEAALDVMEHAPAEQKQSLPLRIFRNWALIEKGEKAEARREIEAILKTASVPVVLLQRSLLDLQEKRVEQGRAGLEHVLAGNPADVRALDALVSSYASAHQAEAGLKKLAAYAAKSPKSAQVQYLYSMWLSRTGRIDEASRALLNAKSAAPTSALIDVRLAELAFAKHDLTAARKLLEPVLAVSAANARAQMLMGHVESVSGHSDAAIARYRQVLESEAKNAEALNNLASLLATNPSNIDEALSFASKARELAPANPDVSETLGWVLYRKGLYASAVPYLQTAARGSNPVANYHLAMAYAQLGDRQKAQSAFAEGNRNGQSLPEAKDARELLSRQLQGGSL